MVLRNWASSSGVAEARSISIFFSSLYSFKTRTHFFVDSRVDVGTELLSKLSNSRSLVVPNLGFFGWLSPAISSNFSKVAMTAKQKASSTLLHSVDRQSWSLSGCSCFFPVWFLFATKFLSKCSFSDVLLPTCRADEKVILPAAIGNGR